MSSRKEPELTEARPDLRRSDPRFLGPWRIVEMAVWDQDFVDLEVPGHFTFENDQIGEFQFGLVRGRLDCRYDANRAWVEFSWEGADDADHASGRGWAEIDGDRLRGHFFKHLGDDSSFEATRAASGGKSRPSRPRGKPTGQRM